MTTVSGEQPIPKPLACVIIFVMCASTGFLLLPLGYKWLGWLLWIVLSTMLLATVRHYYFSRHVLVLLISMGILGVVPINTQITPGHMTLMGAAMIMTVASPYIITRYILRDRAIRFPFIVGRQWKRAEIIYIFIGGIIAYLLLPFYLSSTGSYLNWTVDTDPGSLVRLFIGTNALGIWDEVFFVGICLAIFKRYLPFIWANTAQAMLWTSFLYELGFRGWWGPFAVFVFAFSQGYIFRRTKSMLYIISVHLMIDFILFLTLIHLHHPEYLRIFITSPN